MPRPTRADEAGGLYHALNRGNARTAIFRKEGDYEAFVRILAEGLERYKVELLAYQLMPNHWHMVLRPTKDGAMSNLLRWVTGTHTMRYHAHYHTSGEGHVYQGRFKSFPVQDDDHFCVVCRYVERNALRAGLVDARYKRSSTAVLRNLAALLPSKARAPDGRFLAAATFAVGDRVRVEKDETVPLDGRLLHGEAWVSEACLTGESRPVHKAPADRLFAGSTLTAGSAELELTATSQGSTLARVLDQVQQAMLRPHRWSRLANRIAAGFFPVVIALRQPNDTPQLRGAPDAREKTVRHIA